MTHAPIFHKLKTPLVTTPVTPSTTSQHNQHSNSSNSKIARFTEDTDSTNIPSFDDFTPEQHLRKWYYDSFPKDLRARITVTFAVTVLILSMIALVALPESRNAITDLWTHDSQYRAYRINERAFTYGEIFQLQNARALAKFYAGEYYEESYGLFRVLNSSEHRRHIPLDEEKLELSARIYPHAISNVIDHMYIRTAQDNPLALIRATREAVECYRRLGDLVNEKPIQKDGASTDHHTDQARPAMRDEGMCETPEEEEQVSPQSMGMHRSGRQLIHKLQKTCAGPTLRFAHRNVDIPFAQEKCKVLHPFRHEVPRLFQKLASWIASDPFELHGNPAAHASKLIPAAAHIYYNVFMIRPFSREIEQEILFNYLVETYLKLPPLSFGPHADECPMLHDFREFLASEMTPEQRHRMVTAARIGANELSTESIPQLYKFITGKIEESRKYMSLEDSEPAEPGTGI
mmetsp:Transcript_1680/g.5888  ORF Transcript_1680/g.5888 Transcript_1680/m.5888 type:complete len:461 (-) Transcript_1680:2188-3570(-)